MKYKTILFIFLLQLSFQKLRSQNLIGFQGGISINSVATDISNRSFTSIVSNTGYSFDMLFQHYINKWLYTEVAPNITQKNYSILRTGQFLGAYTQYNNTYLQLPVTIGAVYGNRFQIFADAGAYSGYWCAGRTKGKVPDIFSATATGGTRQTFDLSSFNEKYHFDPAVDMRTEYGWVGGVGLRYKASTVCSLLINCSYYKALTSQQKKPEPDIIPQHNQTLLLSVGSLFIIK